MNVTARGGGEANTMEDWVEVHGDYLFNFAVRQLRDTSVAENLVQDTFLAAFKSRKCFGGYSSERTWLPGILRRRIYDHLRHPRRERVVRTDVPVTHGDGDAWEDAGLWLHDVASECAQPCRRMELAEFRTNLESAIGTLPPRVPLKMENW